MIPKIIYSTIFIEQPSTKKQLSFRRFLVKEEKILLIAKESKDINDIFKAVKDVVQVCCQEENFDVNKIPLFDLEYIYLQLRASSVSNVERITITDREDKKEYSFFLDFNDIKVIFKEDAPNQNIQVNDVIIVMKYPEASIYDDADIKEKIVANGLFELVVNCIDKVYHEDELIIMTKKELEDFVDNLDIKTYKKIEKFLLSTPSLSYEIKYKNSLDHDRTLTFNSLIDFFLFL